MHDDLLGDDDYNYNQRQEYKCPELRVKINGIPVTALVDSGSQLCAVSEEWFNQNREGLGTFEMLRMHNTTIKTAVGKKTRAITHQILVEVNINGRREDGVFVVVPELIRDCIIGVDFLYNGGCIMNFQKKQIQFTSTDEHQSTETHAEMLSVELQQQDYQEVITQIDNKVNEIATLSEAEREELYRILVDNKEVFREAPGRIKEYQHKLEITDRTPYCQKSWPVPIKYQAAVAEEIKRMVKFGIIERSSSAYINPIVTVIKKDQTVRLCLDARRLNSVTVPDFEGAIPVDQVLASCGKIKVMSSIDLTSSFWQIPLAPESRDFTGFMYQGKCYRYTVTPFGLKNSLASLTRGLDRVLSEEVKKFTVIYVDDCLCISQSVTEHLKHLQLLLENLKQANITVNFRKSQFFRERINYLGYELSTKGISAAPDKVAAIQNFPRPKNQKQLKGFLGLTNFYNKFSSRYAGITQPLTQLLKKNVKFIWTKEVDECFNEVKRLFINTVMLRHPDPHKRFYLQTDASKYALGGQLYQLDDQQQIGVVAFTSRLFRGAELNYFTTEKELLCIVHCLKKFRMYVLGKPLTIITDNKALTFIKKCHMNNSRITRWILGIQEYDFDVIHCKGTDNVVADILSRNPEDLSNQHGINNNDELEINSLYIQISKEIKEKLRKVAQFQKGDEKLAAIIHSINTDGTSDLLKNYQWFNEKLYRKDKGRWKLLLPAELSFQVMKEIHKAYGHAGGKKTLELFKEHFTCDAMTKTLKRVIKPCDTCQRCKDSSRHLTGETRPVLPTRKGELISLDYYGPLPASRGGVKFILVIIDTFTKYVKLYAVRRATTTITIRKLKVYIEEHGKPSAVLTDNGTQFTSKQWTDELSKLGIRSKYTAIRNPRTNLAERVNRQLGNLFRVLVGECHTRWATYLELIEVCLNQTYHSTIEVTPYEAQLGMKPIRDWSQFIDEELVTDEPCIEPDKIYMRIHEKGSKRAQKANEKNNITKFKVGDIVLVRACPTSDLLSRVISKFCTIYEGPYRIKKQIGNSSYAVEHMDTPEKERGLFNVRQLKPYFKSK